MITTKDTATKNTNVSINIVRIRNIFDIIQLKRIEHNIKITNNSGSHSLIVGRLRPYVIHSLKQYGYNVACGYTLEDTSYTIIKW